jgi:hypothetical protein
MITSYWSSPLARGRPQCRMNGSSGFTRTAFDVQKRQNLYFVPFTSPTHIGAGCPKDEL